MTEWTDDLTVLLPPGRTVGELVDVVLQATLKGVASEVIERTLARDFGLSESDAALALDRSMGGLVRAATGNVANCPARDKDPMAWEAFHRGIDDPAIVARIFPQFVRKL
jgi:hypothetical protein